MVFRWFKHLSDATEAYQVKEGKPKHPDHNNEPEEETVQDLPSSSREATERAEPVGGTETQNNAETESAVTATATTAVESNQRNSSEVSTEDDKEKLLSQTEGDSSSSAPSAGELTKSIFY